MSAAVEVFAPGPLPIIKAICEECGLVDVLDEHLEWDEEQCLLSPSQRLVALLMTCLTERQPLYRMPEFFRNTDTDNLFGEEVTPDHLNDDALGRALDKLIAAEPRIVLGTVLLEAAAREGVSTDVLHADTTSFSVQGRYESEESADDMLSITHGYSKDHRPDLRQFNIGLGVNRAGVPLLGDILDGNTSDKTWNTELIAELRERLATDEPPVYVADSAAVTESSLTHATDEGIRIISRLPRVYNAVDSLIDRAWGLEEWVDIGAFTDEEDAASYRLQSFHETISGHEMRCIVVHSSTLDSRTERRIETDIESTETELLDQTERLADRAFTREAGAHEAWKAWLSDRDEPCFELEAEIIETERKKSRDKPGRPPKEWEPYETVYQIATSVQRDATAIADRKAKASCFVIVTSLDNAEKWPAEKVLREYKEQQAVERRFPVLKDPKRVGPVYLDRPDRVEALGYVLFMALLVYSLIERRAREALADEDDPMNMTGGMHSYRPTGRRVLERFENVLVIRNGGTREIPENVEVPARVLELLDLHVGVYGVDEMA